MRTGGEYVDGLSVSQDGRIGSIEALGRLVTDKPWIVNGCLGGGEKGRGTRHKLGSLQLPQVLIKPRKIAGVHWWQGEGGLLSFG